MYLCVYIDIWATAVRVQEHLWLSMSEGEGEVCIFTYVYPYVYTHDCICMYICGYLYIMVEYEWEGTRRGTYVSIYIHIHICIHIYIQDGSMGLSLGAEEEVLMTKSVLWQLAAECRQVQKYATINFPWYMYTYSNMCI
jgi:hypothetical protein